MIIQCKNFYSELENNHNYKFFNEFDEIFFVTDHMKVKYEINR